MRSLPDWAGTFPFSWTNDEVGDQQLVSYRIRVRDAAGNFAHTAARSATLLDRTPPARPVLTVEWLDPGLNSGAAQTVRVAITSDLPADAVEPAATPLG